MDITSQAFWLFAFQMLQSLGQVGAAIVAFYAVWLVQNYTARRMGQTS
jgi:hypothetical protein